MVTQKGPEAASRHTGMSDRLLFGMIIPEGFQLTPPAASSLSSGWLALTPIRHLPPTLTGDWRFRTCRTVRDICICSTRNRTHHVPGLSVRGIRIIRTETMMDKVYESRLADMLAIPSLQGGPVAVAWAGNLTSFVCQRHSTETNLPIATPSMSGFLLFSRQCLQTRRLDSR